MSRRKPVKIDWSHGPVRCAFEGCTTMLRPNNQRAEGEWAGTAVHKGRGMCFRHCQEMAEERFSERLRTRSGSPQMTVRGAAARVCWPLPAEGTWLGREKRDLERWARAELGRLGYRVTGRTGFTVHHGLDPFISVVFRVQAVPLLRRERLARSGVAA